MIVAVIWGSTAKRATISVSSIEPSWLVSKSCKSLSTMVVVALSAAAIVAAKLERAVEPASEIDVLTKFCAANAAPARQASSTTAQSSRCSSINIACSEDTPLKLAPYDQLSVLLTSEHSSTPSAFASMKEIASGNTLAEQSARNWLTVALKSAEATSS